LESSSYNFTEVSGQSDRDSTFATSTPETEIMYRLFMENAEEAIFIAQDGLIVYPNAKLSDFLGVPIEELIGRSLADFVNPDDRDFVLTWYSNREREEKFINTCRLRLLSRTNTEYWTEISSILIKWQGRKASLNFIHDVTLQKKYEAQLLQAQKMEAIGTLAGGIAHDFNNLLMAIQGQVSLMLQDIKPHDPHYPRLKRIEQHIKTGAELTNQLIGFARGGKYEVTVLDLNELIQSTVTIFSRTNKEISVYQRYASDLWPVEVDKNQLKQVLIHIYVNAREAMPNGGNLYIETANVILNEGYHKPFTVPKGSYVKISITDTGIGMDEETKQRIFEPFFTTKERGRGTGLGLAFAYGVIKNHGGYINVYSEKGQGTTFSIYLPASQKKLPSQTSSLKATLQGTETILLVDDEEAILEVSKELLEMLGYKVFTAANGQEAVDLYREKQGEIDLVILDMIMPGLSGSETYNHLKRINPHLRVLLASGYTITKETSKILNNGPNSFIQKPYTIDDLSVKIRELLDQ